MNKMFWRIGQLSIMNLLCMAGLVSTNKGREAVANLEECQQCFGFGEGVNRQNVSEKYLSRNHFIFNIL